MMFQLSFKVGWAKQEHTYYLQSLNIFLHGNINKNWVKGLTPDPLAQGCPLLILQLQHTHRTVGRYAPLTNYPPDIDQISVAN